MSQRTRTAPAAPHKGRSATTPHKGRPAAPPVRSGRPAAEARDDLDSGAEISPAEVLHRVYRFFISKRTGITLILAMGFLTLIGTLLEQAPDRVRDDPQAYASWLDSVRPKYRGWTGPLDKIGMFEVFSSIWFKTVVILLAISILACTYHRAGRLWKQAIHPRTHVGEGFFEHAGLRAEATVPVSPAEAIERVRTALRRHRFRTVTDPKGPGLNLYADRFRFGPLGTVLSHLAFVIILMGVLVSNLTGFKNPDFTVTIGSRSDVRHGTGLSVEALSFSESYHPNGSPKDYVSDLVLYKDGKRVARQSVRVNQPLRYDGVAIHQSYFGVAAVMQVKDANGKVLFDSGVPLQYSTDDGRHSIGEFTVPAQAGQSGQASQAGQSGQPGQNLTVHVISPASGQVDPNIAAGQALVKVYQGGGEEPVAQDLLTQGRPAAIGNLTFTFQRERQFTGLLVKRDPGAMWIWAGSGLMMLGLIMVFFFRHRRVWVRIRPVGTGGGTGTGGGKGTGTGTGAGSGSAVLIASPERRDSAFESWFRRFAADVEHSPDSAAMTSRSSSSSSS